MNAALTLYQLITAQLPDQPDLSVVQKPEPCPEAWPLLLESLHYERRRLTGFFVSDAQKNRVFCRCTVEEQTEKLIDLGEGAIVHLRGAVPRYFEAHGGYGLDVDNILKLKEYDEEMKHVAQKRAKREARTRAQLMAEGVIEDDSSSASS
jgi:hypothetical protein